MLNELIGGELGQERFPNAFVLVFFDFVNAGRVNAFLVAKPVEPIKENADILFHDDGGFSMNQNICIEQNTHSVSSLDMSVYPLVNGKLVNKHAFHGQAAQSAQSSSACLSTVSVAFSCLSGG